MLRRKAGTPENMGVGFLKRLTEQDTLKDDASCPGRATVWP